MLSLRYVICGVAPLTRHLLEAVERRFGPQVLEGHGLSDGTCGSSVNPYYEPSTIEAIGLLSVSVQGPIDAITKGEVCTASS